DGRNQEEIEPRVIAEENAQIGDAILVEIADVKGEGAHRQQVDDDEHVSERRREIGGKLPLEDRQNLSHAAAPARRSRACCASWVVSERKTSSSRPASAYSSLTSHFCSAA